MKFEGWPCKWEKELVLELRTLAVIRENLCFAPSTNMVDHGHLYLQF